MALPFFVGLGSSVLLGNRPVSNAIDQALFGLLPNEPMDAITLVDLLRRGEINNTEYEANMQLLGYTSERAQFILTAAQQLISANEILNHRRQAGQKEVLDYANGVIQEPEYNTNISNLDTEFTTNMSLIGFDATEATKFREANREIPQFGQFLEFMAKEVFEPEQRSKFTLDAEIPDIFVKFASQFDVSATEASNYWASHWNHVSPEQLFEMFHRFRSDRTDVNTEGLTALGLTHDDVKVSFADVQDYMKLIELPQYWRERLTAIAFRPFPQIMLRWGYEEGLITQNQVIARLKDIGFSDGDSELMAEIFARRFTTGRKKNFQDNTLELYKLRAIDRSSAEADLLSEGLSQSDVDFSLDKIDENLNEEYIQLQLKSVLKKFVKGYIEEDDLDTEIEAITSNPERTAFIKNDMIEVKESAKPKLTVAQILKAYKSGVLDEAETDTRLLELNYEQTDIDILKSITTGEE